MLNDVLIGFGGNLNIYSCKILRKQDEIDLAQSKRHIKAIYFC